MSHKYEDCKTCVFRDCDDEVCEDCEDGSEYVPDENSERDEEGVEELRRMTFIPRQQEIVSDPDEGLDWILNQLAA